MPRLQFQEGTSSKFWEVTVHGNTFTVQYGKLGTTGQSLTKTFADESSARREADKLTQEKLRKGYRQVGDDAPADLVGQQLPPAPPPPQPPPTLLPPTEGEVLWTEALKKKTHGRRGLWHAPLELADPEAVLHNLARELYRAWLRAFQYDETCAPYKETLLATPTDALYAVTDDPRLEGIRAQVFHLTYDQTVIPYLGREMGPAFALQALIWQHCISFGACWLALRDPGDPDQAGWQALRNVVAASSPADYAKAVEVAASLREEYADERFRLIRCGIAYAFPDQTEWGNQAARDQLARKAVDPLAACLLGAISDRDVLLAFSKKIAKLEDYYWGAYAPDLLANLGAGAAPVLTLLLDAAKRAAHKQQLVECLALIPNQEVANYVVRHLPEKHMAKLGSAYLSRHLDLFERAMESLPSPPDAAVGLLARTRPKTTSGPQAVQADSPQLPEILARPPWTDKLKRKPLSLPSLALLPHDDYIDWAPGEIEVVSCRKDPWKGELPEPTRSTQRDQELNDDLTAWLTQGWHRYRAKVIGRYQDWSVLSAALMDMTSEAALALLNAPLPPVPDPGQMGGSYLPLLARFGLAAQPWLQEVAAGANHYISASLLSQLQIVISPRVAQVFAPMAIGRKDQRPYARAWLSQHPEVAAIGIIPVAVGASSASRSKAETALRWLARQGHREIIVEVATRYGPPTLAAVNEILDSDLGFDKMPKLPNFWTPEVWTPPLLHNGQAVPTSALAHLGTLLAVSTLDDPHYGLAQVREACTPRSLSAFAEDLFNAWLVAGGPAQQAWTFHALAHLGDDETIRKLVTHMHKWPTEGAGGRTRTLTGLDILAGQGSDLSLLYLQRFAQTARIRAIQVKAQETLEEVAHSRSLTLDQLEDRLVPDLGLDPNGTARLDFGPRAFTVRFDETLKPRLVDDNGSILAQFPRATKDDEPAQAEAASARWKQLVDQASTVANAQIFRLEQAMCKQRRWDETTFRQFLLHHPLQGILVRRLLWGVFQDGQLKQSFRVDEDRKLLNAGDDPFTLPPEASIGLPHRLEMTDQQGHLWGQVFADYVILQPFPQLGRDTYTIKPAQVEEKTISTEAKTSAGRLRGLANRGWHMLVDDTWVHCYTKKLTDTASLEIDFEPGWDVTGSGGGDQTAKGVRSSVPLGQLSPIAYSEMVRDYQWLTAP